MPFPSAASGGKASPILVELQSVEDAWFNKALSVIGEVEPDASVLPTSSRLGFVIAIPAIIRAVARRFARPEVD